MKLDRPPPIATFSQEERDRCEEVDFVLKRTVLLYCGVDFRNTGRLPVLLFNHYLGTKYSKGSPQSVQHRAVCVLVWMSFRLSLWGILHNGKMDPVNILTTLAGPNGTNRIRLAEFVRAHQFSSTVKRTERVK